MKSKFNLLLALFTFALYLSSFGAEKTKEIHESWAASEIQALSIVNKFGEVKINNNGGSEVTIDVEVTVEASTESKAASLLNLIEINIRKSGSTIIAETEIEKDFKSQRDFSINYTVNIPSDKDLDITNKFGNTVINELNASGNFDISYGNLTAVTLNDPSGEKINISLGYGEATIESLSDASVEIKYSKMRVMEAKNIVIDSKYSVIGVEELKSVDADSKYDTFNFDEIGTLKADTKYTHINIEELKNSLVIESGYGSINVEEVSRDFELIDVTNSYGAISLGLSDESSYDLNASCDYCGISYDSDNFQGNRMEENHTKKVDGKVGSGSSTGRVTITSRYGGIKLR